MKMREVIEVDYDIPNDWYAVMHVGTSVVVGLFSESTAAREWLHDRYNVIPSLFVVKKVSIG